MSMKRQIPVIRCEYAKEGEGAYPLILRSLELYIQRAARGFFQKCGGTAAAFQEQRHEG